ncbi:zinc finger domain-containing protein, partial [Klebsiella pneumoniae]
SNSNRLAELAQRMGKAAYLIDDASDMLKGLKVALSKAEGEKCPRCWHYTTDIGKVAEHAEICGRCVSNVAGDGEQRKFA